MTGRLRVLIADDEPLARQNLRLLLQRQADIEVVAECGDGDSAASRLRAGDIDLAFLDIQMPGQDGLELARALGAEGPLVVFVTAYDRYTLEAFDAEAIDYLLKPFDDERFGRALERARRRLRDRLVALIPQTRAAGRLALRTSQQTSYVDLGEIDWIEAADYCVVVHARGRSLQVRDSMQAMSDRLGNREFLRIHRSAIVRLDRVSAIERVARGHHDAILADGTRVRIGRSQLTELERRLADHPRRP